MATLKEFIVWVEIEEITIDENGNEDHETISIPENAGRFDTVEKAEAHRAFITKVRK